MPANVGVAAEALGAASAKAGEAGDDVVAEAERRHLIADGLDDARSLVPEHDAAVERVAAVAVDHVQVAVADARGDGADQNLAARWPIDVDGFDAHRHMRGATDGSLDLHGDTSSHRLGAAGV